MEEEVKLFCRGYDGYAGMERFSIDQADFLKETLEYFRLEDHEDADEWIEEWNKILKEKPDAELDDYIERITGGEKSGGISNGDMVDGRAMHRGELYLYVAWG